MPNYGEFSAKVIVDGNALLEYDVKVEAPALEYATTEPAIVHCWVPSEIGKEFEVHTTIPTSSDYTCKLLIDNQQCGYQLRQSKSNSATLKFEGLRIGPTEIVPFLFSRVETSDDDTLLNKTVTSGQGEIVVDAVQVQTHYETEKEFRTWNTIPQSEKQHERMKKAIDHRVGFGAAKTAPRLGSSLQVSTIQRVVKFVFKYRPLDILQANGIAPLPPRPPQDVKPEIIELSDDEDDATAEREEKALRKRLAEIEKKRKTKRVKTEHRPVKMERGSGSGNLDEVIDLTL